MIYYICQRHDQCNRPCDKNCLYTSDFFKSKIYHDHKNGITFKGTKDFLTDNSQNNNKWEVDWDWDKNLPESNRADVPMRKWSYNQLENIEIKRKLIRIANGVKPK